MGRLLNSKDQEGNVISGDTLNVTKGAGVGAVILALVTAINPLFDAVFGDNVPTWIKAAIIMTAIASWAWIAAADALARRYASGRAVPAVATLPRGLRATYTKETDVPGYKVAALRLDPASSDKPTFLIVKQDEDPKWATAEDLKFVT